VPIDGYHSNVIKIEKSGVVTWNGNDLATRDGGPEIVLEKYLGMIASLKEVRPFTTIDFDAGAPCARIDAVRRLMIKHLRCSDEDRCFQGDYFQRH